jgi:outer membrane lipopolysaccharide assembly protein LptE/RlpB
MKLTHFALTGLFLLLAAGMYLTMKTDMDGRMEEMKADADRKYELLQKAIKEGQQQPAALADAKEKVTTGLNEVK